MQVDVLVAEIGSTTTLVNAFDNIANEPCFLGQGQAPTSVIAGDVCIGLDSACRDLAAKLGYSSISGKDFLATSSAAGGLVMSVHGLVYDMTVKAAKAAALGAGAVLRQTTAGRLTPFDLEKIQEIQPKLILLAGGTDYGERETALYNAQLLADLDLQIPIIYAGNCQNEDAVKRIFADSRAELYVTENVYPQLDNLNIEPARFIIQQAFEKHIVQAPGMEHIRDRVNGGIMPTPGAVMASVQLLQSAIGDLAVIDVGGATTDVHSAAEGSEEIARIATGPEPFAKRTVEGDLGVYVNVDNLLELTDKTAATRELGIDIERVRAAYLPIPLTDEQMKLTAYLTKIAAFKALERHVGVLRSLFSASGRHNVAEGKDLSSLKYLVATGGALTRLPQRQAIMRALADCNTAGKLLFPKPAKLKILFDNDYIMASLGVMSRRYPQAALKLLKRSLHFHD